MHFIGGWVGPTAGLDAVTKRKIPNCSPPGIEPRSSNPTPREGEETGVSTSGKQISRRQNKQVLMRSKALCPSKYSWMWYIAVFCVRVHMKRKGNAYSILVGKPVVQNTCKPEKETGSQ
jgi:hypothetical protein